MVVTWVTFNTTGGSVVEYGLHVVGYFTDVVKGREDLFQDGGSEKRKLYIHRVVLTGLTPDAKYGM